MTGLVVNYRQFLSQPVLESISHGDLLLSKIEGHTELKHLSATTSRDNNLSEHSFLMVPTFSLL